MFQSINTTAAGAGLSDQLLKWSNQGVLELDLSQPVLWQVVRFRLIAHVIMLLERYFFIPPSIIPRPMMNEYDDVMKEKYPFIASSSYIIEY